MTLKNGMAPTERSPTGISPVRMALSRSSSQEKAPIMSAFPLMNPLA